MSLIPHGEETEIIISDCPPALTRYAQAYLLRAARYHVEQNSYDITKLICYGWNGLKGRNRVIRRVWQAACKRSGLPIAN